MPKYDKTVGINYTLKLKFYGVNTSILNKKDCDNLKLE